MANDLNLKKSWNPKSFKNREVVWKREKEIYDTYKKNQENHFNSEKLKEQNELLTLATSSSSDNKLEKKIRWMYKADDNTWPGMGKEDNINSTNMKEEKPKLIGIDHIVINRKEPKELVKPKPDQVLSKDDPMYAIQLARAKQKDLASRRKRSKSADHSHSKHRKRSHKEESPDSYDSKKKRK